MNKLEILPQTVFVFEAEPELLENSKHLVEQLRFRRNARNQVQEKSLEREAAFSPLKQWFNDCLSQVQREVDYCNCGPIVVSQMWANRSDPGEWHHPHIHPNSVISGVFYLTNSQASTWFSIPDIWGPMPTYLSLRPRDDELQYHTCYKHQTAPGQLIMFPSTLTHSVNEHSGFDEPRYSIAFNSFPTDFIGSAEGHMHVSLDVN
jgi:uncharacterized protein (TIGR02466 family)